MKTIRQLGDSLLKKQFTKFIKEGSSVFLRRISLKKKEISIYEFAHTRSTTFAVWGPVLGLVFLKPSVDECIKKLILSNDEIRGKRDKYFPTHVIQIIRTRVGAYNECINVFYISSADKKSLDNDLVIPHLIGSL